MAYYPFAPEIGARYELIGPTGAVAVFNDAIDPNYVGMLSEVTGLDSPDVREASEDLVEADGGQHGQFWFGRRPIVLNGRVYGHATAAERAARLDRLARASLALRGDAVLKWKPATRRENLITNPRAINDTADWQSNIAGVVNSGGTITRATGVAPAVGTTAIQVATSGTGNATQGAAIAFPVRAGEAYAVSVQARRTAGTDTYTVSLAGAASGNLVSGGSASSFTTYTTTFTASSTGTAYVRIAGASTNTLASTFQISDVMVAPGTDTTYRDGDTTGWHWQGTIGNSTSGDFIEMLTWVRRQQPLRQSGAWNKEFQLALVSEYAPIFSAQSRTLTSTTGGSVIAENRGSYPSFPILRITAVGSAATNPTVTWTEPNPDVVLTTTGLTLAVGETIEVDTLNHTAKFIAGTRNGQNANQFINWATTGWPYLNTGNNTFQASANTTVAVVWRDAWA